MQDTFFTYDVIASLSKPAGNVINWIECMKKFRNAYKMIAPLIQMVTEKTEQLNKELARLAKKQEELDEVNKVVARKQAELNEYKIIADEKNEILQDYQNKL